MVIVMSLGKREELKREEAGLGTKDLLEENSFGSKDTHPRVVIEELWTIASPTGKRTFGS
eukprot:1152793-Pelagomonas_calceolata.AAC.2